jgi:hypothetical protein
VSTLSHQDRCILSPTLPARKDCFTQSWPTARRSELVLKRARFLYALVMRMPFCLYKHILQIMLEMRDEHATGLPFACLVTKIRLHSLTDIAETEPKVRVQDALGSQTLMKSNAHIQFEDQDEAH